MAADFIKAAAMMRGVLVGADYAEAFETVRLIVDEISIKLLGET
jgi:hypothetical protein